MNKPSKYTTELLRFLENVQQYPEMMEWIEGLPELDRADVFREMENYFREQYLKTGEINWLDKANLIADGIDDYEEEILDNKLDKALFMMQFDNVEINPEQIPFFLMEARKVIIKVILSNPENIKEIWKLAKKLIKIEKESGLYNPANWIEVL